MNIIDSVQSAFEENFVTYRWRDREQNILNHYQRQVDLNRMDSSIAINRCIRDICGDNYNPKKDQRSLGLFSPLVTTKSSESTQ